MTASNRSLVEVRFDNGDTVTDRLSWSLRETFSDPLGRMSFEVAPRPPNVRRYREGLRKGERVTCLVDGIQQADMMVETTEWALDKDDGLVGRIECVSPLALLYEGGVDPRISKKLASDVPVLDLVAEVVEPFGLGDVFAENDIAAIKSKTGKGADAAPTPVEPLKYSEAKAQDNETAYAFLGRILTRLGVMLRMDMGTGQVWITAPHYTGSPLYSVVQAREDVWKATADRMFNVRESATNAGQFQACSVRGAPSDRTFRTRANRPEAATTTSELNATRPPYMSTKYGYKPRFVRDTSCRDMVTAKRVGKLVLGLPAERAYQVRGTVHGVVSTSAKGAPWTVDTLGRVVSEALEIGEVMWLSERIMSESVDGAQSTELVWLPKGAFTLGAT